MTNKKIIVASLLALGTVVLIAAAVYLIFYRGQTEGVPRNQEISVGDPLDIALDFYNPWLDAVRSTSTNPYLSGLATKGILSEMLRNRLIGSEGRAATDIDPVLCQTTTPEKVTGRIVSKQDDQVRVLVMSKDKTLTAQSVFTLKSHQDGWFIEDILCSPGEFDVPREFTFDKEGFLLKSVPPPYNPENWHLVFEEDGEPGHVVPLLFTDSSSCVATDKNATVCSPEQFTEAKKVHIYGQMTENGATVTRLESLE